jgi:AcrR family transcriptional regulator
MPGDPVSQGKTLSSTAQTLLSAARTIVSRKGYSALNMKAVGQQAGMNSSLVHYHFGSKSGLVAALVDSLMLDSSRLAKHHVQAIRPKETPVDALLRAHRRISEGWQELRLFYELLPHVLRSPTLRERLASEYADAREQDAAWFARSGLAEIDARRLSTLSVGVLDGLGMHLTLDRDLDHAGAYDLWQELVRAYVAYAGNPPADSGDSSDDGQRSQG